MQRTLITFLGTTGYSETVYRWEGLGEHRTPHIGAALGKLWKADRIVILATQAAEDKNAKPLQDSLGAAGCPSPLFKRLPDGRTEEELWTQFQLIREAVELGASGDVLMDITHGFRTQSFFAGAVLSVLRAAGLKPDQIELVYGEYHESEPTSPIWDLTLFSELVDWAQALGLFLKTGVAAPVVELGLRMRRRETERVLASKGRDFPRFDRLVKAIECFADDLATIRVASIITGYEQDDSKKSSARGSAARLLDAIRQYHEEVAAKLPPLALILDQLAESVRPLSAARLYGVDGQRAQYALARYYLTLGRYPEAAAVVREARVSHHAEDERGVEVNSPHYAQEQRLAADERFGKLDPDALEIAEIRNDIEHGGFREQPLSAKVLQPRIEQLVERFTPVENGEGEGTPPQVSHSVRHRTFFVSRHASAVEWAARQGIRVDAKVRDLDPADVEPGDTVIGTLPVHFAAKICARGARYLHLTLEIPPDWRGRELTAEDMVRFGAQLVEHHVERCFA